MQNLLKLIQEILRKKLGKIKGRWENNERQYETGKGRGTRGEKTGDDKNIAHDDNS